MATTPVLTIYRGEAVTIPWDVDEDISGWTVVLSVHDRLQDAPPTLSVTATVTDAGLGYCEVALTAAQTATLAAGTWYYELARTNLSAEAVLAQGRLIVRPRVGVA